MQYLDTLSSIGTRCLIAHLEHAKIHHAFIFNAIDIVISKLAHDNLKSNSQYPAATILLLARVTGYFVASLLTNAMNYSMNSMVKLAMSVSGFAVGYLVRELTPKSYQSSQMII